VENQSSLLQNAYNSYIANKLYFADIDVSRRLLRQPLAGVIFYRKNELRKSMISAVATTATPNAAAGASSAWLNAVQAQTNPSISTAAGASPASTNWRPWVIAQSDFDAAYKAVATYVAEKKFDAIVTYFANKPDQLFKVYWGFAKALVDEI
jgi:hypothetical protein